MAAFDLPLNDVHLSALFHNQASEDSSMKSAMERADASTSPAPTTSTASAAFDTSPPYKPDPEELSEFVTNVPPVVTRLLVELGPFLSHLRWALQVVSWKSGQYSDSWLTLAAFWAVCLGLNFTVR